MKIVVLEGKAVNPGDLSWDELRALGDVTVYETTPQDKVIERIRDAEVVFLNKTIMSREIIEACPKLKYIGELATGYNNIDISFAKQKGIPVSNIPAYSTTSVAQHTFALLLELCAHVGDHSRGVLNGKWSNSDNFCYWDTPLVELAGKTIGLIGFGNIGKAVSKISLSLGMNVIAVTSHPRTSSEIDGVEMVALNDLFKRSNIISLHCPLTESNKHLICNNTISQMQDGVFIINTARGGLVNEQDVATALISKKLGGFATDVLSQEPPTNGSPLFKAPNCIITPHIAWAPIESRQRLLKTAIGNFISFLNGNLQNIVN